MSTDQDARMKAASQPIVDEIWREKYRLKNSDGTSDERERSATEWRICQGIYSMYPDQIGDACWAVENLLWAPGGRQLAGAGTDLHVTLFNCFVSPTIEDSMRTEINENSAGIMEALQIAALTQQMGGGIGMDFSTLRPNGALVRRRATSACGPLKFMDMWDSMCRTIMAAGARRGAMMATLRCDHPDIMHFVKAKHKHGRLNMFNVSVLVTDEFMKAVRDDDMWYLHSTQPRSDNKHVSIIKGSEGQNEPVYVYERIKARELWDAILRSTYDHAEPGVIFIDRVNRMNNLNYLEKISCTNPCGEQPLPPNGNCNLGAVNLAMFVKQPFTEHAAIDFETLDRVVPIGVQWLDNAIDVSLYPTKTQEDEGKAKRRIGLGITGLGNMLQQLRIRYGSEDAIQTTKRVMQFIRDRAYRASVDLAKTRGSFPGFDKDKFLKGEFIRNLPPDVLEGISEYGIRNGVLLTIAPTGTTSIFYGNVSSGVEPTFAWTYKRKMLAPDDTHREYEVEDFGYRLYKLLGLDVNDLPDWMVTAQDITVREHVVMQAACQEFIDSSVSKTINVPQDTSFEDFKDVYTAAYDMGCKGCTTYRPNPDSSRGSVLSLTDSDDTTQSPKFVEPREDVLHGKTYKVKWPHLSWAFYVTINDKEDCNGQRRPFEIFINSKSIEHQEWITALTRSISAVFRANFNTGRDVSFLIEELEQVHASKGGAWINGKYVPSVVAMIGNKVHDHLRSLGLLDDDNEGREDPALSETIEVAEQVGTSVTDGQELSAADSPTILAETCPKCNAPALIRKEGCSVCLQCGYSNCD